MFKKIFRVIFSLGRFLPELLKLKEVSVPLEGRENNPILSVNIRIIQNADGEEVITNGFPNFGGIDEKTFHAYEKEASRILSENPVFIPLFQHGALLEVGVTDSNPQAEVVTNYMGIQIIGAQNKFLKDKSLDFGKIGISRLRTKDIPFCSFDVRLVLL